MTFESILALFSTMIILALIPSPSVFAVVGRSIDSGFTHGFATAVGIVIGDIVYIIAVVLGLSFIAETADSLLFIVKYIGALLLIWFGISLFRSKPKIIDISKHKQTSLLSSFSSGLLITLGDEKAFLFYLGFLPAFVDLPSLSPFDVLIIISVTVVAVGGAKISYAFLSSKAKILFQTPKTIRMFNYLGGCILIGTAIFLIFTNHI